jgi:hypothetical protein
MTLCFVIIWAHSLRLGSSMVCQRAEVKNEVGGTLSEFAVFRRNLLVGHLIGILTEPIYFK